jgi:general secretion pathway protein J
VSANNAAAREGGFTLLEILVVVVVLGLLVVGLAHGVHTGLALWSAQQRRVGQTAELDAGARILRILLTGIPASPSGGTGEAAGDNGFSGDAVHLRFVGDLPTGFGTTRRANIALGLHQGNLVLTWAPHLHEILLGPSPPPTETELVARVKRLDIAYWGAAAPDQLPAWQARWDGPAPPELVRIRLAFGKGDDRRWPDLIVAPVL